MAHRDVVAIGGSSDPNRVLSELLADLPGAFPGSIFMTIHTPANHESYLAALLARRSQMPVSTVVDGQPIESGKAYVAPRDRHLLLLQGVMRLGKGPRENLARPSIDPMIRSAALSYGPRTIGVILSGMLNDGSAGLYAVKEASGLAVVQHPLDAEAGEMPRAALEAVDADHVAKDADLAPLISRLVDLPAPAASPPPSSLALEVEIAAGRRLGSELLRRFADPVALTCPDCQGVLSEVREQRPLRYRCQIGHAYTAEQLAAKHELLDEAVRIAMRVMEERVELVSRIEGEARASGRVATAELYETRAAEYRRYADVLRAAGLAAMHDEALLNGEELAAF